MTPAYAEIMHADASSRDKWLTWILTAADVEHPGKYVARAHQADHQGGTVQPGALVADTLDELRAMLPTDLTRSARTSALPPDVIETWD